MKCLFCGSELVSKQIEYSVLDGEGNRHILNLDVSFCPGDLNYYVSKQNIEMIREIQKRGIPNE